MSDAALTGPILTIGEILVEIMADTPGTGFREPIALTGPYPSGAPAVYIDQVARLGHGAAMIGAVGDDDFGRVNLDRLAGDGVDVSGIAVVADRPTGSAFIRYRPDGARDYVFNLVHSANAALVPTPATDRLIGAARHLHIMGASLSAPAMRAMILGAARAVKGRGGTVSLDPNLRKELLGAPGLRTALDAALGLADVFLPSGEELFLFDPGADEATAIARVLSRGPRAVVVKRGAEGASYHDGTQVLVQPGFPVTEVDPTGAGDAFGAAFTCGWLAGDPAAALRLACAAGALAVTARGPMEGCASAAEIAAFLATRP